VSQDVDPESPVRRFNLSSFCARRACGIVGRAPDGNPDTINAASRLSGLETALERNRRHPTLIWSWARARRPIRPTCPRYSWLPGAGLDL